MRVHFPTRFVKPPGLPGIVCTEAIVLPCGCACYVGVNVPMGCEAIATIACSPSHGDLMRDFEEAMTSALGFLEERPLIEIAEDVMRETRGVRGLRW